jgi:hypothetical protein
MQFRFFALAFAFIFALNATTSSAPLCPHQRGQSFRSVLAVDQSDSISVSQLAQWEPAARALVSQLCPGDSLQIFTIHNNTLNAKPLFDDSLPLAPSANATIANRILFKRQMLDFQQAADLALLQAFQRAAAVTATDIFSLFDRIRSNPSRQVRLVIFSDGLHSNAELNLERFPLKLKPGTLGPLIQRLATHHGWDSTTLAGASVAFVLPSLNAGPDKSPGPNDRLVLKDFYDVLVRSLGGVLKSFDTQLGGAL